jgi:hypothetical protein
MTRGSTEAYLDRNARSMTVGHVKISELTSIERRGPKLHDT